MTRRLSPAPDPAPRPPGSPAPLRDAVLAVRYAVAGPVAWAAMWVEPTEGGSIYGTGIWPGDPPGSAADPLAACRADAGALHAVLATLRQGAVLVEAAVSVAPGGPRDRAVSLWQVLEQAGIAAELGPGPDPGSAVRVAGALVRRRVRPPETPHAARMMDGARDVPAASPRTPPSSIYRSPFRRSR